MNYGPLVFLAALFAMATSWLGFVLVPQMQIGQLQQTNTVPATVPYPASRPGLAQQGLDVYRENGCFYCHSQQARQSGTVCEVVLADAGTNHDATVSALRTVNTDFAKADRQELLSGLPKTVLPGVSRQQADLAIKTLKAAGAKAELWIVPTGPDIARGWGKRRSVAEDFLVDSTVMLGSQRIGYDLANAGVRKPDPNWHLRHLYEPKLEVPDSTMPPYRYLFEEKKNSTRPFAECVGTFG